MIRKSPTHTYRAIGAVLAVAVITAFTSQRAAAQTVDLFGGTGTPTMLSVNSFVSLPESTSGNFGPGYNGTVSISAGVASSLTEGFNALGGGTNSFEISNAGLATLAGTTTAAKTFTGTSLLAGGTYQLTLTRASGFDANLLGNVNLSLNEGSTPVLNTATGVGLAGIVDLLGLFGSTNTDTLQFTVPAGATGNITLNITSSEVAGILPGSYTFSSASITQVPEPRTVVTSLLGMSGLAILRMRRRLRNA